MKYRSFDENPENVKTSTYYWITKHKPIQRGKYV